MKSIRYPLLLTATVLAAQLALGVSLTQARPTCGGKVADIVKGAGNDRLVNPIGPQVIVLGGGNDVLITRTGSKGPDTVCGGPGDDQINSGSGADRVFGNDGADSIIGEKGGDKVYGGPGNDLVRSGRGVDRIYGSSGDDSIYTDAGKDWIDAGSGDDTVFGQDGREKATRGGDGDDFIDTGAGGETVYGGSGADYIRGRDGSDFIYGGSGPDRIYGDQVDDHLYGEAGDDVVIGGHGIDFLYGDEDADLLRGGTNGDDYFGGSGIDTVSFATATPPGASAGIPGVRIDAGSAAGDDGSSETLSSIESILGSPYADDNNSGRAFEDLCGAPGCAHEQVLVDDRTDRDVGLVLIGDDSADDDWAVSSNGTTVSIVSSSPLSAGNGCTPTASGATCEIPADLGFIAAWTGDGDDRIEIDSAVADTATTDLDGSDGDDEVIGGPLDDVIIDGGGRDLLSGRAGADALISNIGADELVGGDGNDQLVTNTICVPHSFSGGGGIQDIAGFARVQDVGIEAKLGGTAKARNDSSCAATTVSADLEILEGTSQNDVLIGTNGSDTIYARQGDDLLKGLGGEDRLFGSIGRDDCSGGGGPTLFDGCEIKRR